MIFDMKIQLYMIYFLTIIAFSNMTSPVICRFDSHPVENSYEFESTWLA